MATLSAGGPQFDMTPLFSNTRNGNYTGRGRSLPKRWLFLAAVVLIYTLAVAQNAPQVTGVDPESGKA